jgi:outer membrane cobalamin receptor
MNLRLKLGKFFLIYALLSVFSTSLAFGQSKVQVGKSILKGKIIDANDKKNLEFATISLFTSKDSAFVAGTITNKRGEFEIKELKANQYYFKVEYLGYQSVESNAITIEDSQKKQLKKPLELQLNTEALGEVSVTGQRQFERVEYDRKVYAVSKSIIAEGGSMTDVLVSIPSVDTNPEGELTLRRAAPQILIDGRRTKLLGISPSDVLKSMAAADVDRVEVITTPSSKYSAQGSGGIINIILKKNRTKGFSGNTKLYGATKKRHGGSVSLNHRTGKFNFTGGFNYVNDWAGRDFELNRSIRKNTGTIKKNERLKEDADVDFGNEMHLVNLGVDYLINKKNTLSFNYSNRYQIQNFNGTYEYNYSDLNSGNPIKSQTLDGNKDTKYVSNIYALSFVKKLKKKGQKISFDASYRDIFGNQFYKSLEGNQLVSFNKGKIYKDGFIVRSDYVHPIGKRGKIETGYFFEGEYYDFINKVKYKKETYDESVHAAYLMYSGSKGKFRYQFGLRAEYTDINITGNEYDDDFLDLFPSFNLGYQLSKKFSLGVGYSKMIYRANNLQINSFQVESDIENQRMGNIAVKPYYSHKPEINFAFRTKKISLSGALYYMYKNESVNSFRYINENGNAVVSYTNLDYELDTGLELYASMKLKKWWSLSGMFFAGIEKYKAKSNNAYGLKSNKEFHFYNKWSSTFKLPKSYALRITAKYQDPISILQGKYKELWSVDMLIQKRILKRKGVLVLQVQDIFNSYNHRIRTWGPEFNQYLKNEYERQYVKLNFVYFFGKRYRIFKSKKKQSRTNIEVKDI